MAANGENVERERRVGENETLFRDLNERLNARVKPHSFWRALSDWVCECPDETCTERIGMTPEEYEDLRTDPTHFAVATNEKHVVPDVERIVEKNERYWVVEKLGVAAEVAEELDAR